MASNDNARDILEAALDDAFSAPQDTLHSPVDIRPSSNVAPVTSPPTVDSGGEETSASQPSVPSALASDDSWKEDYEAQLRSWRSQSAEQREKAEKERARWEAIRTQERIETEHRRASGVGPPPQEVSSSLATKSGPTERPTQTHSHAETGVDELQKWENVPSLASSFPSLSFEAPAPAEPPTPKPPTSVTLSIFDSTLSTRTRVLAFASSLAMNLLLPFINGVMLGFGEIFAKNVVLGWFGWKNTATTNVGLRTSSHQKTTR